MIVLNLTQHAASPEQRAAGVCDLEGADLTELRELLTFEELPDAAEIRRRAEATARLAGGTGAAAAMIGGAPYLMAPLERELRARGIRPLYAFSRRESVEQTQPDGSIRKVAVFRHLGFVEAPSALDDPAIAKAIESFEAAAEYGGPYDLVRPLKGLGI